MSDFYNKYPYTDFHELNLDWVIERVKQLTEDWIATHDDWEQVVSEWHTEQQAFQDLHDYVMNYFDNLDVQDEINHKLDEMAQDGTLDALLLPYFNAYKNEINALIADQDHDIEILEARMDTFSHLAEGSTTGDAELMDGRVGANGITYPNIGDAIRGQYTELNDKISILDDIPITNIHSGIIKNGTNLLPIAVKYDDEYAVGTVGTAIVHTSNNSYTAFRIELPITKGQYYFTHQARFTRVADENDIVLQLKDNTTNIDITAANAKYLYVSVHDDNISGFMVGFGDTPKATEYVLTELYDNISPVIFSKGYGRVTGNMNPGDSLTILPSLSIAKNNDFTFFAKITSFSSIKIGRGTNTNGAAYLEITATQAIIHTYLGGDTPVTYNHGLTIGTFISVKIVKHDIYADIMIMTDSGTYNISNAAWSGTAYAAAVATSVGSTLTECVFSWGSSDFRKSTWIFGDSYISISSNRWPYYLKEDGFLDAVLINGYPGQDSSTSWREFSSALQTMGQPDTVIWCMGMNDGADPDADTPSSTWLTSFKYVEQYCITYGVKLILSTIPSVPGILHEGKNKYVRNSGYRYIDFAKAVGAQSDGTWYTGMLSTDNIHPTDKGALALYCRALADAPEISYK